MPGPVNEEQTVTLTSSTSISEDGEIIPGILPIPALRTSTPKQASPEEAEKTISDTLPKAPPVLLKSRALQEENLLDINTQVPPSSPSQTKNESTHAFLSEVQRSSDLGGSSDNGSEEPSDAIPELNKKTSKESLNSGIDGQNSILNRSPSQETVFDDPDKTLTRLSRESSNKLSNVPSTSPPSYKTDDSEESLSLNSDVGGTTNKKTNRFLPRAKYALQHKSFVIPATSSFLITIYLSSSYLYRLLYLKETINFIDSIKSFQIWPLVTISSGLAVIGLCALIYNYRNTESPDVRGIDDLRNVVSENNLVHDITIYKKNNDLIKFKNKSYAGHRNIPNFTYKKLKLVKERVLFNICLSSFITIGSIYPLIKYLELGSEGFIKFFSFSSEKEALMISKFFAPENDAKLLSYFNNHNLKLFAFAAVLTVLAASLIGTVYYYHNEKTHIEPLKFDIFVTDNVKARNDRYFEVVKNKISEDKISTEIETVVVRHYNDVDEEKKTTVSALKMAR